MIIIGIYTIVNVQSGHRYVGSSNNIPLRLVGHFRELNRGVHINQYLQRAWDLYGREAFTAGVLEVCSIENLIDREQYYLDLFFPEGTLYNLARRASCPAATSDRWKEIGRVKAIEQGYLPVDDSIEDSTNYFGLRPSRFVNRPR